MSDNEEQSSSAETTQGTSQSVGELNAKAGEQRKKQRTQLRGKITRFINRVKKFIEQGAEMRTLESSEPQTACESMKPKSNSHDLSSPQAFDTWIDDLVEFKETTLSQNMSQMSIAEALYKLEANKDIPSIQLIKYDGNPLTYIEFIERFKLLIHDKPHLPDDVRMAQLKMHLIGRLNVIAHKRQ